VTLEPEEAALPETKTVLADDHEAGASAVDARR
jgi:hypothetical protein